MTEPEPLPPPPKAQDVAPPPSLNHGGPGICRLCYPVGAPLPDKPEQGELGL